MFDAEYSALTSAGWNLRIASESGNLPPEILARYPALPSALSQFLGEIELCVNSDDTAWFLTPREFEGSSESAFAWNEFELMSLEAAEGDPSLEAEVSAFWDAHFPFLLSVRDGYSFFAVSLKGPRRGAVVHGREPEFESVSMVASTFPAFLKQIAAADCPPKLRSWSDAL